MAGKTQSWCELEEVAKNWSEPSLIIFLANSIKRGIFAVLPTFMAKVGLMKHKIGFFMDNCKLLIVTFLLAG